MPARTPTVVKPPEPRYFRPKRIWFVFGYGIAMTFLVASAWLAPVALLFGVPLMALCAAIGAFSNAGIIVYEEGIAWYALVPRWRFRIVPLHAVLGARRNFFGRGGVIYITVESGRYELTVWGDPRPGDTEILEIRMGTVVRGDEVLPAIEAWLQWRDAAGAARATAPGAGAW